jgi:hypothetical protein
MSAAKVPAWVTDGWYANNPEKQQLAIARYHSPVATEREREAARVFNRLSEMPIAVWAGTTPEAIALVDEMMSHVQTPTYPCTACRRFAFAAPRICFWCGRQATLEFKP